MTSLNRPSQGLGARLWLFLVGRICLAYERVRGTSTVSEVASPARLNAKMVATSVLGYALSVYCQRKHYQRIYDRFFVPTRHHVIYQISAVASNDAPEILKQACGEVTLTICSSMHYAVDQEFQERYVLNSYLDLLIAHLRRRDPSIQAA